MATPTNLPASTTPGQVLTSQYVNDLRGAFRVLQVVRGSTTTLASSTSSSYADTGITATITPQSTSSKILVLCNASLYNSAASTDAALRLLRDATTVINNSGYAFSTGGTQSADPFIVALDSPASVSALVYKLQFARVSGAGTVFINPNSNTGQITLMEISA
jgi:hypothetical protein